MRVTPSWMVFAAHIAAEVNRRVCGDWREDAREFSAPLFRGHEHVFPPWRSDMSNVPDAGDVNEVISLLQYALEGHEVVIGIADADADLSPEEVAARIGSSRQHVYRLIDAGKLTATTLANSRRRRIRMRDLAAYERDVQRREKRMAEWSSTLARLDPDDD